jgi:hypothetical protein
LETTEDVVDDDSRTQALLKVLKRASTLSDESTSQKLETYRISKQAARPETETEQIFKELTRKKIQQLFKSSFLGTHSVYAQM